MVTKKKLKKFDNNYIYIDKKGYKYSKEQIEGYPFFTNKIELNDKYNVTKKALNFNLFFKLTITIFFFILIIVGLLFKEWI